MPNIIIQRLHSAGNSQPSFMQGLALGVTIIAVIFAAYLYWTKSQLKAPVNDTGNQDQPTASEPSPQVVDSDTPAIDTIYSTDKDKADETALTEAQAKEKLSEISAHSIIQGWISNAEMLRKTVAITDNIAQHKLPKKDLSMFTPKQKFPVLAEGKQFLLDTAGYERYNSIAEGIASLDAKLSVQVFQAFEAVLQTLYEELGYTNKTFRSTLLTAIENILKAPIIHEPIYLVQPKVYYQYADPELEALSTIDKQMLRMGPVNTLLIQEKLTEIAALIKNLPTDSTKTP